MNYLFGIVASTKAATVTPKTGILVNYIKNINWDHVISFIISKVLLFILICLAFIIINSLGKKFIRKVILHTNKKGKKSDYIADGRVRTIYTLVSNIFHYTMLFFLIYAILSLFGIPIGTLIAGAGIASVALGLGAQGFITDVVTGFFILLEQQFSVGDTVKIANIQGTVQAIGLRTTQIISTDGTLHFIPNRQITIVSNMSRNPMQAIVNIRIEPDTDIEQMTNIVKKINQKMTPHHPDIISGPTIQGPVDIGKGELVYRVIMMTKSGSQAILQREFLHAYLTAFTKSGIRVPTSPLDLTPEKKE